MCRIRHFLAILSSFFHSSLLYTFSCHTSPPTDNSLPFSAASSIPLCYILFPATLLHQLTIPCCSQQLLPFLSVIYFFLPLFSTNYSSIVMYSLLGNSPASEF